MLITQLRPQRSFSANQGGGDDVIVIFKITGSGVLGRGTQYEVADGESTRNFDAFAELESLEFKVPIAYLVIGCVPRKKSSSIDPKYEIYIDTEYNRPEP
jgi:hypothetical protein